MRGLYDTILEEFPPDFGKAISKKEREEKQLYTPTLIYGEIDFDSFGTSFLFLISFIIIYYLKLTFTFSLFTFSIKN